MANGIVVEGLTEFCAAVRSATGKAPRAITLGLKKAGVPIIAQAAASMPKKTGRLAGSLSAAVRGSKADIISRVPYAGGAEWGRFGKWAGFNRYGGPPRFVYPAVERQQDVAALILLNELRDVVTINGWAR